MENKTKRILSTVAAALSLSMIIFIFGSPIQAQCFGTTEQWLAAIASSKDAPQQAQTRTTETKGVTPAISDDEDNRGPGIVGMWHVHYLGPFPPAGEQEAYQIFNVGGTEVHNPNVDPRGGSLCLGAWAQSGRRTFKLTHRVWLYDPAGNFHGVGHLEANITVSADGASQTGTLTFQVFDLAGNPVSPVFPGTLSGERVSPN